MDKFLIIWASVLRVIPLPFGTTPLGAFGLFAGSQLSMGRALTVPLVALVVGDLVIGFYSWVVMLFVYAGFVLTPLIGRWLIRDRRHAGQIGIAVGANALVFYAVSNFGNWWRFTQRLLRVWSPTMWPACRFADTPLWLTWPIAPFYSAGMRQCSGYELQGSRPDERQDAYRIPSSFSDRDRGRSRPAGGTGGRVALL